MYNLYIIVEDFIVKVADGFAANYSAASYKISLPKSIVSMVAYLIDVNEMYSFEALLAFLPH